MIEQTVGELLKERVVLEVEGLDRVYLNLYQPRLQTGGGVVGFFKHHRGAKVVSTTLMGPMSEGFVKSIQRFAKAHEVNVVHFERHQRKDDVTAERLRGFEGSEGVLYIGVAQEKYNTFRVHKRRDASTGKSFPQLYRSSVMCNQYYFYLVDEDFGPLFIKFSSYFPYTGRICLNGHEYAKRQLAKEGIAFEALDNGVASCANPQRLQRILNDLDEVKIDALVRKWLARLPHPFTPEDRAADYRYALSVLQSEYSLTQVFDRPLSGRHLFEEVIRENLDLGRPQNVSLIFQRRITKRTPGRFRTRVITDGVIPSLHVSYKDAKIKQYFKEGRALRTETTINNTRDFGVGRSLRNLPALRAIGFAANRRLLEVEKISQDCQLAEQTFAQVNAPQVVDGQRASALRFGESRAMALLQALCLFVRRPQGFANADLREHVAALMNEPPERYTTRRMTYDLRRLRLHGLIERLPHSRAYRVTETGTRVALFLTKVHDHVLRPGISQLMDGCPNSPRRPLAAAMRQLDRSIEQLVTEAKLAA